MRSHLQKLNCIDFNLFCVHCYIFCKKKNNFTAKYRLDGQIVHIHKHINDAGNTAHILGFTYYYPPDFKLGFFFEIFNLEIFIYLDM